MAAKESNIFKACQIRATELGARLWRQNSGISWAGKAIRVEKNGQYALKTGDVIIRNGCALRSGFPGISDGGGYCMVTVTPEMVGQQLPVVLQVETKADGGVTDEQRKFIKHIRGVGGRAGIARSSDDVDRIVNGEMVD
ncbi:MAG: hypothetical protein [Bacteriophage sp.]|nr:MAG: hypothetical protein [Bacteriophage sp.]